MVDWSNEGKVKDEVSKYFPYCPFCSERTVFGRRDNSSGDDSAECSTCGAKWHSYHGFSDEMKWAELVRIGKEGGDNFIGVKHKSEFWRNLSLNNEKQKTNNLRAVSDKPSVIEIVKEKEVIVKVRCPYCHKLYDETANACPNCGASC
jgi:hypothetical protein